MSKTVIVQPCPLCGRDPIYVGTMNAFGDQGVQCSCGLTFKRSHPQIIPAECYVKGHIRNTLKKLEARTLKLMLKDWNRRGSKQRKS